MFNCPTRAGFSLLPRVFTRQEYIMAFAPIDAKYVVTELNPVLTEELLHSALAGADLHVPKVHTHAPAGAEGEIQFNEAGAFQADSKLFWDNVNKRLGIGTDSPAYNLDVSGTMRVTGHHEGNTHDLLSYLRWQNGGVTQGIIMGKNASHIGVFISKTVGQHAFVVGDYSYWNTLHGIADQPTPTLYVFSDTNPTITGTEWISMTHDVTNGVIKTGKGDIVLTPASERVKVNGAISSATLTITASQDNLDVSGVNTIFINPAAAVIVAGFTGGVIGQKIDVVCIDADQNVTMEHDDPGNTADQHLFLHLSLNETLDSHYGGWQFVCDGSNWYDNSHARHV